MPLLSQVTSILDAAGNRADLPQPDGTFAPIQLQVGAGFTATPTASGGQSIVKLSISSAFVGPSRTLTAGAGLTGGGDLSADRAFAVGQNADGTIVVNADDVQLKAAFTTLLNSATSAATANALAQRDAQKGIAFGAITSTVSGLGATTSNVDTLQNTTAAANGAQQWSGAFALLGQAWDTGAGASRAAGWRDYAKTVQGNPGTSELHFDSIYNGAASPVLAFAASGGLSNMGGIFVDPAFGTGGATPVFEVGFPASTSDINARGILFQAQDTTNADAAATGGGVVIYSGAGKDAAHAGALAIGCGGSGNNSYINMHGGLTDGAGGTPSTYDFHMAQLRILNGIANPQVLYQSKAGANGQPLTFLGQNITGGGNWAGGPIVAQGGGRQGTGRHGGIQLATGSGWMVAEAADLDASGASRSAVFALFRGSAVTSTQVPTGDGVLYIAEAVTVSGTPVGGFSIYVDPADHILKAKGTSGTVTPLALP